MNYLAEGTAAHSPTIIPSARSSFVEFHKLRKNLRATFASGVGDPEKMPGFSSTSVAGDDS
jgi:hypothetical protein